MSADVQSMSTQQIEMPINQNCEDQLDEEIFKLLANAPPCTSQQTFEDMLDFIDQRSITYKMFRNEFNALPNAKPGKRKLAAKSSNKPPSATVPKYIVHLPQNHSLFTVKEMKELFAVFIASEGTAPTAAQMMTISNYSARLKEENREFLCVVKQRWVDEHVQRTDIVKEGVALFIATWWKNRISRVRTYPQKYSAKPISSISLSPSEHQVKLEFLKTLFDCGSPPNFQYLDPVKANIRLTQAPAILKEMMDNEITYAQNTSASFNEVSKDAIAERLALDNQAQLVLSPSIIATLLSNNPTTYEECWCIPFVVREYKIDVKKDAPGEHTRKIIYLDKKLSHQSLTAFQKNLIYAKYAIRTILLLGQRYWEKVGGKEQDKSEAEVERGCPYLDGNAVGKEEIPKKVNNFFKKRLEYNLWECSAADPSSVLSKHHRKPFKILVRTPIRGQVGKKKIPGGPQLHTHSVLLPKLDLQPEFGAAITSFSEIAKEWAHAMLRPNSLVHRVRTDPVQGNTIMVQSKSAGELSNECMRVHFRRIQNHLSILQNLFDALGNLPPGNYLLNHQVKDHGFMTVYPEQKDKTPTSWTAMNLWSIYDGVGTTATCKPLSTPWVPLDTTVLTPTFRQLQRIPCVFGPVKARRFARKFHYGDNTKQGNSPCKKKKGKSKRKNKKRKSTTGDAAGPGVGTSPKQRKRIPYHDIDAITNEFTVAE